MPVLVDGVAVAVNDVAVEVLPQPEEHPPPLVGGEAGDEVTVLGAERGSELVGEFDPPVIIPDGEATPMLTIGF